ncbi:hypothetical protein CDD82_1785 [Ophiocordyceps australis]|uniref:Signal peptide-containing protein n=1 Tax=Ophiocordyceps australis TaxID=1399860 RepID=A0A2C5YB65_9HYPO|nr:hypothetical protein CDD82_1785 [Ophiocordyceps australis]
MSFPVAFQSAVFYFVACTPCAKVRHRHKAKEQARKERQQKAQLETEQPGLYRHPSPFNTNPYWQEEISMGPRLPKKAASKNSSQRRLMSSGRDSSVPSVMETTNEATESAASADDDETVSDDWNTRRGYQREDEELWGQLGGHHRLMDALSKARDSAGRLIDATLGIDKEVTDDERREFYQSPRIPPVNDYHPPVVSNRPAHRDARKWMLQPPPPAKVMEGKVPVTRAVSTASKSSSRTVASDMGLSRLTLDKMAVERIRRDNYTTQTETELLQTLLVTNGRRYSHSTRRSASASLDGSDDSDYAEKPSSKHTRRRRESPHPAEPRAVNADALTPDNARLAAAAAASPPPDVSSPAAVVPLAHAAQRPRLETIPSLEASNGSGRALTKKSMRRRMSSRNRGARWTDSPVGDDSD